MSIVTSGKGVVVSPDVKHRPKKQISQLSVVVHWAKKDHEDDDCFMVKCEYPDGLIKHHQLFEKENTLKLFEFVASTFKHVYDRNVVLKEKLPATFNELTGYVMELADGE